MALLTPLRFGVFELELQTGELRRKGVKVRLADQPRQILQLLLERPGELVTREQLRERLWTEGTFVDFETGLNTAVRKLREALDDSAANPRFIERVPRRGYRFIAPVSSEPASQPEPAAPATPAIQTPGSYSRDGGDVHRDRRGGRAHRPHGRRSRREPDRGRRHRHAPPRSRRAANGPAHELYQKGLLAFGAQSPQAMRDAVGYFERAVAADPDFADAYSVLAYAHFQFLAGGVLAPHDVAPKVEAAARKAIELDDTLAMAHRSLGAILHTYYWNWDEGDREFRRATELSGDAVEHSRERIPGADSRPPHRRSPR